MSRAPAYVVRWARPVGSTTATGTAVPQHDGQATYDWVFCSAGKPSRALLAWLVCSVTLHAGAASGYLDWLALLGMTIVGNLVGGLVLVAVLRPLQVPTRVIHVRT